MPWSVFQGLLERGSGKLQLDGYKTITDEEIKEGNWSIDSVVYLSVEWTSSDVAYVLGEWVLSNRKLERPVIRDVRR
jgi:hypothetical protein